MSQVEPVAARVPWLTQDGNHESNCPCNEVPPSSLAAGMVWFNGSDSGGECGVPYFARFTMPRYRGKARPWYSSRIGPVAVVRTARSRSTYDLGEVY